jgi:bilirubin oxidase
MGRVSSLPLLLAASAALIGAPLSSTTANRDALLTGGDTLRTPPVLTDVSPVPRRVEVSLTAARLRTSLAVGTTSEVFAYNGQIPGPTLELREGDQVVVHFRNDLPEQTTVHWHGLHLPFESDGSPFHPVEPGESRDYVFTVRPGSAGTYWYHPHPHHRTGYQVAKGLAGAVIVRAADDPLPANLTEKLLILTDTRLNPDGSIDLPEEGSHAARVDRENGREGELLFVNGQVFPTLRIRAGEVQRWRILNASASRVYRLALAGHTLTHVGSDGGLFERPVEVREIVLASAERVEVLVRGTGAAGARVELQALPYDRYIPQTRPSGWNRARPLLTLEYANGPPVTPPHIPARLRTIPVLDTTRATATRVISLSQGLINGREMDMGRIDVSATLGGTEIWEVENLVGMDHPFHLHGFQFQVIDRDGVPEPFRSWKDTVNVPRHQTVRFIVRYENYPGKWMFHCHILDHEDHGMMGVLEVR